MKKKGFTLVELLAVIVILAVISLIATPMILGVIETARKEAAVESVNGILDATQKYMVASMITGDNQTRFDFPDENKLSYKGTKPESGTVVVDRDGNMSITVKINGYCIRKRFSEVTPSIIEDENCVIEETEILYAENYREDILNGADPVIAGNLVPVTINADGTVYKADVKKEWYNYENKVWANAVVLKDGTTVESDGTIKEENIKQYYVWIPRYKYQLWNVNSEALYPNGTEGESVINIVFENKNTAVSNGDENGEWLTHPAFQTFDTNGLWVGKFETSYDEETYTNSSLFLTTNPNYTSATSGSNILIKANVRSLTAKLASEFYTMISETNPELNSHMMKNMEWGAVAYLTYSNYGKCNGSSCEEVYMNNINTGYVSKAVQYTEQWAYGATITGCSADTTSPSVSSNQSSCASGYAWNEQNNKASTTGNISGIYDMAGGNWEYVMGILEYENTGLPVSGRNERSNSGFNGLYSAPLTDDQTVLSKTSGIEFPDAKYYDLYRYVGTMGETYDDIWYNYMSGKLGDATKEVAVSKTYIPGSDNSLWYSDYVSFPSPPAPWFERGGRYTNGSEAGMFRLDREYGNALSSNGARVVLAY